MVFANPEEELIVAESELCIDYEVDSNEEDDSALGTEGVEMKPWRRYLILSSNIIEMAQCCYLLKSLYPLTAFKTIFCLTLLQLLI